jgi:hypothetical protein
MDTTWNPTPVSDANTTDLICRRHQLVSPINLRTLRVRGWPSREHLIGTSSRTRRVRSDDPVVVGRIRQQAGHVLGHELIAVAGPGRGVGHRHVVVERPPGEAVLESVGHKKIVGISRRKPSNTLHTSVALRQIHVGSALRTIHGNSLSARHRRTRRTHRPAIRPIKRRLQIR